MQEIDGAGKIVLVDRIGPDAAVADDVVVLEMVHRVVLVDVFFEGVHAADYYGGHKKTEARGLIRASDLTRG